MVSTQLREYPKIAVVIPCYRVKEFIAEVINNIGDEVSYIFAVDDFCPDNSGKYIEENISDKRLKVLYNQKNLGVGGAVMTGYHAAIEAGADIIVKVDGDGQMDPKLIPIFVKSIIQGEADYTKGNRFFDLEHIHKMPKLRVFGNAVLSLMNKISSGYWNIFDPTNGYTAISVKVAKKLAFAKISNRYFFESDMLFRLNLIRAVIIDIPMDAKYGDEKSNLVISKVIGDFLCKHCKNFLKRIFYNYFLRDMSLASIELVLGVTLLLFGFTFGGYHWINTLFSGVVNTAGTVMIAAISLIAGLQFILAFLAYDIASVPKYPLSRILES